MAESIEHRSVPAPFTAAAGIAAVAATLCMFPPSRYTFYPACPVHGCTGLLCPGCGATRALAALLRGDVHAAIHLNALFVLVLLPAAMLYLLAACRAGRWLRVPRSAGVAVATIAAAFTVVRNLP